MPDPGAWVNAVQSLGGVVKLARAIRATGRDRELRAFPVIALPTPCPATYLSARVPLKTGSAVNRTACSS